MSGMYWYAVAASDDVAGLKNKGFCITDDGEILYNEQYEYALARMYTNDGHGIVDVEMSNFFFDKDASDRITINAEDPMTTPVLSYKLRMTDQYPDAEWFYFAADKSEEILEDGVPHPLYKSDGTLATKTDYADCEFEALNPMPSEDVCMYGRFTTATFSFATYQSTADVLHVEFTGLHQEDDEYCFADRLRVVVTTSPAPAPALPTVSNTMYLFNSSGGLNIGQINTLLDSNNNTVDYDTTACYACQNCMDSSGVAKNPTSLAIVNESGILKVTNISDSYIRVYYVRTKKCSSNLATVITVYDSSNNPYNAFQYTSDGTDYYYILDGVQTDWTDDLSGIGYSLTPVIVLPTVSMSYAYPNQLWNYSENIGAGGSSVLRDQNGNALSYDSTKSYSALNYYTSTSDSAGTIDTNVSIGASGSFLALFNNGSSQITVQRVNVATCNSTDATVITVYDSSNNPYNAFQYTSDGTDYYYVLDGTQAGWTDDLASIGYKLPIVAWTSNDKQPQTVNGNGRHLYDTNGNYIMYESPFSSFTYTILGYYSSESSAMQSPITGLLIGGTPAGSSGGILDVIYYPGYSSSITIQRVIYFKTPTT